MPKLRKYPRRSPATFFSDTSDLDQIRLYSLRLLTLLGGHRSFIEIDHTHEVSFSDDNIASLIGIDQWLEDKQADDDGIAVISRNQVFKAIQSIHQTAESVADQIQPVKGLRLNCQNLAQIIGLSKTESMILEFAVLLRTSSLLEEATELLKPLSHNQLTQALSILLDRSNQSVHSALSKQGKLHETGLLTIESYSQLMSEKMDLLSPVLDFSCNPISVQDSIFPDT